MLTVSSRMSSEAAATRGQAVAAHPEGVDLDEDLADAVPRVEEALAEGARVTEGRVVRNDLCCSEA